MTREAVATAPVTSVAAVAPVHASVRGAGASGSKPPAEALKRPVVAKAAPPPAPVPFEAKQPALAANPGKPLDAAAMATVKPSAPAPAPAIKIVTPAQPAAAPPKRQAAAQGSPRAQEATKGRQPPDAQAPPPPASAPRAQEEQKGRSREADKAPPQPASAPRPPEAQAPPPKPEAGKSAGKRGERKSDEQLKLEEKLRLEEEDKKRKQ